MPLSEHEQEMLDEMERQLFADDPKLARAFSESEKPRHDGRRVVLGLLGVVLGLVVLVLAVALPAIWLGVLAFLLMLAGAVFAITGPRGGQGKGQGDKPGADPAGGDPNGSSSGDFMRKLEERWERRGGDDGPS
jgi:hypothetical protein